MLLEKGVPYLIEDIETGSRDIVIPEVATIGGDKADSEIALCHSDGWIHNTSRCKVVGVLRFDKIEKDNKIEGVKEDKDVSVKDDQR